MGSECDLLASDGYQHPKVGVGAVRCCPWADRSFDRIWAIWDGGVYDLSDYVNTASIHQGATNYQFLDTDIVQVFTQQAGQDISKDLNKVISGLDSQTAAQNMACIKNMFYLGETDFRKTP